MSYLRQETDNRTYRKIEAIYYENVPAVEIAKQVGMSKENVLDVMQLIFHRNMMRVSR